MMTECTICNFPINVFEPGEYGRMPIAEQILFDAEEAEHQVKHKEKVAAFRELGYWPRGRQERRELEAEALNDLGADDLLTKTRGAYTVFQVYFDKSLDQAAELGDWREHPQDVVEFAKLLNLHAFLPDDVADCVRAQLGPPPGKLIGPSMVWQPGNGEPEDE
jgi:hypothetical protein